MALKKCPEEDWIFGAQRVKHEMPLKLQKSEK